ncbi:MAG TPA: sialate O-acetylesterase [Bacteroidales bacterium]|nr:sialate O-acetylesterase [Bacteroidales bacterium]
MNNQKPAVFKTAWMVTLLLFACNAAMHASITLPYILSDNMVLQHDIPVNIWGWAQPGEKVTVLINGQKIAVKTSASGEWKAVLKPIPAGGPYEMTIKGKNTIVLKNILAGDVWICGGQSNMEWPLSRSRNWSSDKNNTRHENIRLFYVPKDMSMKPLQNTKEASWEMCDEKSASSFSAIGYYFGKNLNEQLNIPIGLINSNWGGTDIETWISLETMYADKDYSRVIDDMKRMNLEELQQESERKLREWQHAIDVEDPGIREKWFLGVADDSQWDKMRLPQAWEGAGLPGLDGVVWFRKEFILNAAEAGKEAVISLGPIDDSDECYINGVSVGKTENRYDLPRVYKIATGLLKEGINVISLKVIDTGGGGGAWGTDNQMYVEVDGNNTNLAGDWRYRVGLNLPAPRETSSPNSFPSLLYNAMIHPLLNFPVKGVIWYQGENNAGNYIKYRSLFPAMINDWRTKWNTGDFSFLFVQLANYMEPSLNPQESSWAGLREAQTMTLKVPGTGMAVIIDIGEAKDIHPRNKDDVGYRLSLAALKITYGRDLVYSGPVFRAMEIMENSIILDFDHIGSGLVAKDKYGYLKSFAVAGPDKKFVWARAYLTPDNKVVVSSDTVKNPVAVRYAWADNPDDANLYNLEGLPACPFRTDSW